MLRYTNFAILTSLSLAIAAFVTPVVAQPTGDTYTLSVQNLQGDFGIVFDPITQTEFDFGFAPLEFTFDGIPETTDGITVNERAIPWAGKPGGIHAVADAGNDGETDFDILEWENPGEIIEFSFTTVDGKWISGDPAAHGGFSIRDLDWPNAEPDTAPQMFAGAWYFYWDRDGTPLADYSIVAPDVGLAVGSHPTDAGVDVVYVFFGDDQIAGFTEIRDGGMDLHINTTILDENDGSFDLLAFVVGLETEGGPVGQPANGFHWGFLVDQLQTAPTLIGDTNGDGDVNEIDFRAVAAAFGTSNSGSVDISGDGFVGLADLVSQQVHFGESQAASPANVPEPTTWALLLISITMYGLIYIRNRRRALLSLKRVPVYCED